MKDMIKEVALEVAEKRGGIIWCEGSLNEEGIVEGKLLQFTTEFLAELSKRAEAVACYGYRYTESRPIYYNPPSVIINGCEPIEAIILFTFPPIHDIEAIENRTAEACAKVYLETHDLTDIADGVRPGEWRKYK